MELRIDHINLRTAGNSKRTRVYVWPVGETILQNLVERRSRPVAEYRAVVQAELADAGIEGKLRWSQKAGCGCGCSPGFIVDGAPVSVDGKVQDVHVHVRAK